MTLTIFLNLGQVEQFNLHVNCGLVTAFLCCSIWHCDHLNWPSIYKSWFCGLLFSVLPLVPEEYCDPWLWHSLEIFSFFSCTYEPSRNKQNDCAPNEDSDQPGHPPSLIRVFAVRMKKAWALSYPLSVQRSKKISNDQELIQSDLTSCPQNQKGNN